MHAQKILFPTDFSTLSDAALKHATALARDMGAKLIIVHVEEPPAAYGTGEMYYGIPDPDMPALTKMLEAVVPGDPKVPYEHRMITGDPAAEIVALAEQEKVELIVLGSHGRTGLGRLLMGSVAEAVVRRAPCAVFTFKENKPAPE
ncbi:MAG TPA: universal stress protein [Pirellulales bacterium]|jgi:nucleotide-binding universal stress UspA family protein